VNPHIGTGRAELAITVGMPRLRVPRPASGFSPDALAATGSALGAAVLRSPASALLRTPGNRLTVIPSTPGAPLFRTTARNAASMLAWVQRLALSGGKSNLRLMAAYGATSPPAPPSKANM
jgi:hypothetical protein